MEVKRFQSMCEQTTCPYLTFLPTCHVHQEVARVQYT